ncbi:unnamed protein product [Effrenium voratum]|uniref:Uncharacterized protein n=1 Tax=Effrenium voratum TaxID=2562239 RepID=A0AA36N0D8_9DINO|nr:unnamed protein product [Effrenium voratum]
MRECTYTGSLPCCAVPSKACFGQQAGWKFQVDPSDPNAARTLRRHEEQRASNEADCEALCSLAAKVTRDAGSFSCECGFFHGKLSRLLNHKCKAAEPRLPAQVRCRRATAALAAAARQVTGAGAAADEAAAHGSEESPLAPVLAEMVSSKSAMPWACCMAERPARAGDFVPHPAMKKSFLQIQSICSDNEVLALRFRPFPLAGECRIHPPAGGEAGGCWRAIPSGKLERARLDRMQVPCVPILAPQPSWSVSSPLSARCFRQSVPGLPRARPAAGELDNLVETSFARSLRSEARLSQKVAQVLQDVCSRPLAYRVMPASCPQADGGVCHIICRGKRRGCKFLTATGMWRCEAATYSCKTHGGFRWNLPVGASSAGATLVGDVMGDWIVHSSFWPPIWQTFLATESYVALERHVRRQVESAVFLALAEHPSASSLPQCDKGEIHWHLLQHCSQTPDAVTLKNWLLSFMSAQMSSEDVAALAAEVVASHGAICCFDFSSSDGARTVFKHRTFMI